MRVYPAHVRPSPNSHRVAGVTVGRAAFALGLAGLLPPLAGVALMLVGELDAGIAVLAYALLILSFLGGMWWGMAMRRAPGRQAPLLVAAVVPSLVAFAILLAAVWLARWDWPLAATGVAVLLTLPVDRRLVERGDAPANWMLLRVPLSIGLGALSILAGALAGG